MIASHFSDDPEALDWLLDQGVDITRTDIHKTVGGRRLPHNGEGRGSFDYPLKILSTIAERGNIHSVRLPRTDGILCDGTWRTTIRRHDQVHNSYVYGKNKGSTSTDVCSLSSTPRSKE